jgi:mRNA interferase HigB
MHIIGDEKLNKFGQTHPNARSALNRWYRLIEDGTFRSIVELRETFPHADPVPVRLGQFSQAGERTTLTVFNIGGNKARLTAFVQYSKQTVLIRRVETHAEYSKRNLKV